MPALAILALCIASSIVYGILHDQITARICVEYFTIGHPPIFDTESPTLLAFGWGIIATWWVGLGLGIALAIAARALAIGRSETARSLVRPIAVLLVVMAACSLLAGVAGFMLAWNGSIFLLEPMASLIPRDRHARFLADLWAHSTGYLVAFVGGIVLIAQVWRSRGQESLPSTGERDTVIP